jgi:hypothetical protein
MICFLLFPKRNGKHHFIFSFFFFNKYQKHWTDKQLWLNRYGNNKTLKKGNRKKTEQAGQTSEKEMHRHAGFILG